MLNLGKDEVEVLSDKWTVQTVDKRPSAHFEHTIAVTDGEPLILTALL
jgi:methionyl aminopeptidase